MAHERPCFSVTLKCSHCSQVGYVIWQEADDFCRARGLGRQLVHVSTGFHPELGRTQSGAPLIICDECDQIQDD